MLSIFNKSRKTLDKASKKTIWRTRLKWWAKEHAHYILPFAASVLTLSSTYILIGPGLNRSGDNEYHLLNEYAIAHAIVAGDNPFGPLGMEFGQPVLRFYQALFYLYNVVVSFLTGIQLLATHNLAIVVCFALSPFSYMYFLRKLGLNRWAAGLGSFASMASIAAFGNSFEAYHQAGIVTQSMGGLFFPWFMGSFIGMLRGENRAASTAVLFALAFLSHAIMSVFAVFGGALYYVVAPIPIRATLKKLAAFSILGVFLVAFWVFPFIDHTSQMRPVPDSIIRGAGVHWFTSVSRSELAMVLFTGRLLDDPPVKHVEQTDPRDKLMDRISIIGTLKTRPPVVTILTGLGALVALLGFKQISRRFLLSGLLFSLMLFAGPDDFRWLKYLPFMAEIQTFRCTYLIEFFAFGLVGLGLDALFRNLGRYVRSRKPFLRRPLTALFAILVFIPLGFFGSEIVLLGQKHMSIRPTDEFDAMIDGIHTLKNQGYPFRISPDYYNGRTKNYQAWLSVNGYQPYCTHWKGTGPSAAYYLCRNISSIGSSRDMLGLSGVRYFAGTESKIEFVADIKDEDGDPFLYRMPNGKDRRKRKNNWHYLMDSGLDYFLRPLAGQPLAVVCNDSQWIWLSKAWMESYRRQLHLTNTPVPMRTRPGQLKSFGMNEQVKTIFYLDDSKLKDDSEALANFQKKGALIVSPVEIPGIKANIANISKRIWDMLPTYMAGKNTEKSKPPTRYELDPGFDNTWIKMLENRKRSRQNYAFDIDTLGPRIAVLPMENIPGWKAAIDGKPLSVFSTGPDMVGVLIPKGSHRVVFYWEMPLWHKINIWMSLLAVAAVIIIWLRSFALIVRKVRDERRAVRICPGA